MSFAGIVASNVQSAGIFMAIVAPFPWSGSSYAAGPTRRRAALAAPPAESASGAEASALPRGLQPAIREERAGHQDDGVQVDQAEVSERVEAVRIVGRQGHRRSPPPLPERSARTPTAEWDCP